MVLGEESREIGEGDLVHVPRNVVHAIRITRSPAVFFTCKSPVGSGEISLDYNAAPNAEEVTERLA
jgi:mannose-6-phosphate isomerase-like protein (cupin superfamily)